MLNFVCVLLWNLALFVAVRMGCWLVGCARPDLTLDGTRLFTGLMAIALAFDTAVTFLVFAEAGGPWRAYDPSETWPQRALAYVLAALLAWLLAWHTRRQESREAREADEVHEANEAREAYEARIAPVSAPNKVPTRQTDAADAR